MIRPIPGMMIEQQPESWCLRACMWAEARGEPAVGRLAVAWVLRNRAMKRDTSIKHEVLRPWQFSSFNDNDPNRGLILMAHKQDPAGWGAVDGIAELFENKATVDPTLGASHYYVMDMANPPDWGRGHATWDETIVIGHHVFGKQA